MDDLEALGFHVGGVRVHHLHRKQRTPGSPDREIAEGNGKGDFIATSVLSGNRNFEGRIGPNIRANYLASPPLVVAYAIKRATSTIDLLQ